jgi:hypothetical protein
MNETEIDDMILDQDVMDSADELVKELELRKEVISILNIRKSTASDAQRGRLDKLVEVVERGDPGWQNQQGVKSVLNDIRRTQSKIQKAQQTADAEMNIKSLITTYNFHIKASGSAVWYYQLPMPNVYGVREWVAIKKETLMSSFPQLDVTIRGGDGVEDYKSLKEFNTKLVEQGRRFTKIIQSYVDEPGALNLMNKTFSAPADDGATDYHWMFDAVFESLSGGLAGSKEFEALQRIIWAKYLHPENIYIPNIVICDVVGRGGKGLFSNRFLRRLFNGNIADNCNIDHVIGKFNSVIAGKAMIIVNETNRSKIDSERTKAFLGSPKIPVEPKGMDIYYADNTGLVMFVTNDINGGVNVGGTKSDNRFSFFNVTESIYSACTRHMTGLEEFEDLSETAIKQWIEGHSFDSGQNILHDEYEVGKWICAMAVKYGDITHVEPHHSDEYRRIVDTQRGAWTQTVEQVFEDPKFKYIRAQLLVDLIRHINRGEMLPGKNRMRQEIERLIRDRGWAVEYKDRANIKNGLEEIQRTVWRHKDLEWKTLDGDETRYGALNDRGIWEWHWTA